MIQALQFFMIQNGLTARFADPRFEALATGSAMTYKYRGQIVPKNKLLRVIADIKKIDADDPKGPLVAADCPGHRVPD